MIWVGLTGGIASGKSTASQFLKQEGAFIVDADQIVHDLLREKKVLIDTIVEHFGEKVRDVSGGINRKSLGEIIFAQANQRLALNKIVHPYVFKKSLSEKNRIAAQHPKAVIIFDAALLIETGSYQKMDWNLLVYVSRQTQIDRLIQRDGLTRADAERRIEAQMPIDDKIAHVNEVIDNQGSRQALEKTIHQSYLMLQKKALMAVKTS